MKKKTTGRTPPHARDIVVIGSSAGGVKALIELVKTLPPGFPASIFIAQHVAPYTESKLPEILTLMGPLPAEHPHDGQAFEPGRIYIAPPDHHLLLEKGQVLVKRGPKENRFRPSVDALFRSAAYIYGPRVIGVVLSGYLDDGTSGLWSVNRLGGITVIQDPEDAAYPDMPANVLEFVKVDHVVPLADLGALLVKLTQEPLPPPGEVGKEDPDLERLGIEFKIARHENAFQLGIINQGELTPFTCPDCHGALTKLVEGNLIRFRCHTGHSYSISALLAEVTESVESTMIQAMRRLEEAFLLLEQLAKHFSENNKPDTAALFSQQAQDMQKQARIIHQSIVNHQILSGNLAGNLSHRKR